MTRPKMINMRVAKVAAVALALAALLLLLAPQLPSSASPGSQRPGTNDAAANAHVFVPTTVVLPERSEEPSPSF